MRLIDADKLPFHECADNDTQCKEAYEFLGIDECIDNTPTVEADVILQQSIRNGLKHLSVVIRPQGEWVFIDDNIFECSVCGRRIWTFSKDVTYFYPFCHCGADMSKGG